MNSDPPRLLDGVDAPDVLRRGLNAARGDGPAAHRLARLAARLPLGGGPGGSSGQPGSEGGSTGQPGLGAPANVGASASAAAPASVLPAVLFGAAMGLVVVGAMSLLPSRSSELAPSYQVAGASTSTVDPRGPDTPSDQAADPIERAAPPVPPPAAPAAPASDRSGLRSAASSPEGASNLAPTAHPAGDPGSAASAESETETALLSRAQGALAARPAEALALTDVHLVRFPGGSFSQEREVIAVTALAALGRGGEAQARAARFIQRYPSSAYGRRLMVLLPDLKIEGADNK